MPRRTCDKTRRSFTPWAGALTAVCLMAASAFAHVSLEQYVRESVAVMVSSGNIDITVQFTFPAALSQVERQSMDRDRDGHISGEEREKYLKGVQERASRLLRLTVDGRALVLIPLEDATLDLQDAPGTEAHPHVLRLALFARAPKALGAGATLRLESGLWTDIPLMVSVSAAAEAGIRLRTTSARGLLPPSKEKTLVRMAEIRCSPRGTREQAQ